MNLKKIFFSAVTVSVLCALTGCDYIEEGKPESSLLKQQEEHNNKIVLLEKQQAQLKSQLETIQKQQTGIINSTKTLTHVIKSVKDQQNTFINGSVIHISLVNLLSTPISNIGFNATWGGEKPVDAKEFARWQQLLFNTSMKSTLKLLPGQWQDINLTLKGVSPNNLGYLKLAINMENIQFDNLPSAENRQKRSKK